MPATLLAALALVLLPLTAPAQTTHANTLRRILLPAPTGPYAVGVTRFALEDPARPDTLRPDGGPRRLVVWLWYPAVPDSVAALPRRPYVDPPTARTLQANQGIPVHITEAVVGHAYPDPAPRGQGRGGWPVLVFSHGLSWPVAYYQTLLADLASLGHVIVAVEHTYGADPVVFPSGEVVPWGLFRDIEEDIPNGALLGYLPTWRDDILFVVKTLERGAVPSTIGRRVLQIADFGKVGAFGHSYGGTAAIHAAERSPTIRGAANLEGAAYVATGPYPVSTPTLYVIGGVNASVLAGTQFRSGDAPLLEAVVRGATHATFSDLMILFRSYSRTMGPAGRIHPTRGSAVAGTLVARYFDGLFAGAAPTALMEGLRMADVDLIRR